MLSLHLPKQYHKDELGELFGVGFSRTIEKLSVAKYGDGLIFFAKFNVVTFYGLLDEQIKGLLLKCGVEWENKPSYKHIYQDYEITISEGMQQDFAVTNDEITVKNESINNIAIIALVLSQSVALERYEQMLNLYLPKSREIIERYKFGIVNSRKQLINFATSMASIRQELVADLYLLDKPDILWDDEVAEKLYTALYFALELKSRFSIIEYKLALLRDEIMFVMEILNQKKSEYLEWIIIVLIGVEIVIGLVTMFK